MIQITLIGAIFSLLLTLGILWANPRRFSNQAFACVTLVQTAWLGCVYRAVRVNSEQLTTNMAEFESWGRANAAVISFLPATIWLLKNAIISNSKRWQTFIKTIPVFILSIASAWLCYHEDFIFTKAIDPSGATTFSRGAPYYIYALIGSTVYLVCIIQIFRQMHAHHGIRRVELQFLALNTGGAALFLGALNVLGHFLSIRELNKLSVLLIFPTSALTAWALLFHRVFNAREILSSLAQRLTFIVILSSSIYAVWNLTNSFVAEPFGMLFSIGLSSSIAVWLDRKSRDWLESGEKQKLQIMRNSALTMASAEFQTERLLTGFEELLRAECKTTTARLLYDKGTTYIGGEITIERGRIAWSALCEIGWATPESLLRRRSTPGLLDLQRFLTEHSLSLLAFIPRGSPNPSVLLALGSRIDERPITYPEVERLQSFVEFLDNIITRSRLTAQVAMQARIEYLAIASRGLAHDLKNLITPVSSFLVYTDGRYSSESAEGEVHNEAMKATRMMTEYVREALSFSEKLSPHLEAAHVAQILTNVFDQTAHRAAHRDVCVTIDDQYTHKITVDRVLVERMLTNLVGNAIDASRPGQSISLKGRTAGVGRVAFEVIDTGCGIPPENIARIFDPYFSTKQFGDSVRGFGLGLTIAQKIASLHHGGISVKSELGKGTTFCVEIPTHPPVLTPSYGLLTTD
jgi:signal transduction histidine kinase